MPAGSNRNALMHCPHALFLLTPVCQSYIIRKEQKHLMSSPPGRQPQAPPLEASGALAGDLANTVSSRGRSIQSPPQRPDPQAHARRNAGERLSYSGDLNSSPEAKITADNLLSSRPNELMPIVPVLCCSGLQSIFLSENTRLRNQHLRGFVEWAKDEQGPVVHPDAKQVVEVRRVDMSQRLNFTDVKRHHPLLRGSCCFGTRCNIQQEFEHGSHPLRAASKVPSVVCDGE
jgi:hypothetical protein